MKESCQNSSGLDHGTRSPHILNLKQRFRPWSRCLYIWQSHLVGPTVVAWVVWASLLSELFVRSRKVHEKATMIKRVTRRSQGKAPGPFGRRLFFEGVPARGWLTLTRLESGKQQPTYIYISIYIYISVGAKATFGSILLDFCWRARHVTGVQKSRKIKKSRKVEQSRCVLSFPLPFWLFDFCILLGVLQIDRR